MSITVEESFVIQSPADRVWRFLTTPAAVVSCIPGAELLNAIDERTYAGRVKVRIGPITTSYAGRAQLTLIDAAERQMRLTADGRESGGAGSARMTMAGSVAALPDGASQVQVSATIDIAGKVMQVGRGLVESVSRQLFAQFADAMRATLEHDTAAAATRPTDADGAALTLAPDSLGDASGFPTPETAGTRRPATPLRLSGLLWAALRDWMWRLFRGRARR
jgi:hypothetical protein